MISIDVDSSALEVIAQQMAATDSQVVAARTSALRKMRKRVEKKIKRAAAKKAKIPQKALGDRFFSENIQPGDDELKVWVGAWYISPFSIGAISPYGVPGKSGGVRAGRRRYKGAFLQKIYNDTTKIWIRLRSKHYSPDLYPTNGRPGDRGLARDSRFPVVRAAIPVDEILEKVLEQNGPEFEKDFIKLFGQELNYQVFVKGARA